MKAKIILQFPIKYCAYKRLIARDLLAYSFVVYICSYPAQVSRKNCGLLSFAIFLSTSVREKYRYWALARREMHL